MSSRPKPPTETTDIDSLLSSLCEQIRSRKAVTWTELGRLGLPESWRGHARTHFARAGFDVLARCVRIPLREQLQAALAVHGQLPLRGIRTMLGGCTARELPLVIDGLVRSGAVVKILRTKAQCLAPADADVLTTDELHALDRCVTEWAKRTNQVRAAETGTLFIWRPDVRALREVLGTFDLNPDKALESSSELRSKLLETVRQKVNPAVGMAFVPAVVQTLQLPVDQVQHLLVQEASRGHLELRPDVGTAHFTEAELSAAPCAPDGSRLLWIRLPEAVAR